MKAIFQDGAKLVWREVEEPTVLPGEALIRVRAAGVNRADLAQRLGKYPPPPGASPILGLEAAGDVLSAPVGSGWEQGDRVCVLLTGGGYAERVAVPARMLMPVPRGLSYEQAAALPEVHLTAYLNLFLEAGLKPGERVLIHGGASGVGTAAIQQARLAGARVATTSSAAKRDACRQLGAELTLDREDPTWPQQLRNAWQSVDVILDMVGASTAHAGIDLLAMGGRLVWIATLSGSTFELDIRSMMMRRLTLKGSTLRSRPLHEKITLRDAFLARFGEALDEGRIVPVIHETVDIEQAEQAHASLQANATIGKIVLRLPVNE